MGSLLPIILEKSSCQGRNLCKVGRPKGYNNKVCHANNFQNMLQILSPHATVEGTRPPPRSSNLDAQSPARSSCLRSTQILSLAKPSCMQEQTSWVTHALCICHILNPEHCYEKKTIEISHQKRSLLSQNTGPAAKLVIQPKAFGRSSSVNKDPPTAASRRAASASIAHKGRSTSTSSS